MSTFTVTSKAYPKTIQSIIICPECASFMKVEDIFNKSGKLFGTSATCLQGCLNEYGKPYFIFSYDEKSLKEKVSLILKAHANKS